MAWRCLVLTRWTQINGANVAEVVRDYPGSWTDITGQEDVPTAPNAVIFEGVVDEATMDAIEDALGDDVLLSEEV